MSKLSDKELADCVVALEVGYRERVWEPGFTGKFTLGAYVPPGGDEYYDITGESGFVEDWKVAGALMEKCYYEKRCDVSTDCCYKEVEAIFSNAEGLPCITVDIGDSIPRAIIEACVEALNVTVKSNS